MEIEVFGDSRKKKEYYSEDYNYYRLYERNFVVSTIIGKLARTFSNAQFQDESGKESELLKKIQIPNNIQSTEEFLKDFAINLFTSGYSMIWNKYGSYGMFSSLEWIVIPTDTDITSVGKKTVTTIINDKREVIKVEDIIFFYDIKRRVDSLEGVSRLRPFKSQIDNITDSQFAKNIQIENSGTTVVSPKSSATNNIDEGLNAPVPTSMGGLKTQKEEMEERLNSRGIANRIIVSNKGLDAKNLSAELNDMKFNEIVESDVLAIYDAYSFPPELSPYGKNATFENKPAAENALIESEIYPLAESLVRSLNQEFAKQGKLLMTYDHLNSVATTKNKIVDVKKTTTDIYLSLVEKEIISKEEAKRILTENGVL